MSGHLPVMLAEVIEALKPRDGAHYVDGTFGGGGYARAILEAADCRVLGIDRDPDAIARGQALVAAFRRPPHAGGRRILPHGCASPMPATAWCWILAFRPSSSTSRRGAFPSAKMARWTCA